MRDRRNQQLHRRLRPFPNRSGRRRNEGLTAGRSSAQPSAPAATSATATAGSRKFRGLTDGFAAVSVIPKLPAAASSSNARSLADWKRFAASFSRQCRMVRASTGGDFRRSRRAASLTLSGDVPRSFMDAFRTSTHCGQPLGPRDSSTSHSCPHVRQRCSPETTFGEGAVTGNLMPSVPAIHVPAPDPTLVLRPPNSRFQKLGRVLSFRESRGSCLSIVTSQNQRYCHCMTVVAATSRRGDFLRQPRPVLRYLEGTSNPNLLNFPHADIIVAPVIEARRFRVRVLGHALRRLDARAVFQGISYAGGVEVWQPIAVSLPASVARRRTRYQTTCAIANLKWDRGNHPV